MPDILIRGMEMPKTCSQCGFRCYDPHRQPSDGLGKGTNVCWFTQEEIWNTQRGERCPLLELPPHGDLIDLQAMLDESENGKYVWVYDLTDLPEFTKDLPVIVPAERGDTDA